MAERGVASRGCDSQPQAREARDPARQALRPGCEELAERTLRRQCRRRKRGPRPKIATVERREACAPRKVRATPHRRGTYGGAFRRSARPSVRVGCNEGTTRARRAAGTKGAVRDG